MMRKNERIELADDLKNQGSATVIRARCILTLIYGYSYHRGRQGKGSSIIYISQLATNEHYHVITGTFSSISIWFLSRNTHSKKDERDDSR